MLVLSAIFLSGCSTDCNFSVQDSPAGILEGHSSSGCEWWLFDAAQQEKVQSFFKANGDACIFVQFNAGKKAEGDLELAFLYAEDTASKINEISSRPVVKIPLSPFRGYSFTVSFAFDKEKECPAGFRIKSSGDSAPVASVSVQRAVIGFDFRGSNPLYAFAPNGGSVIRDRRGADFSGGSQVFGYSNSWNELLPLMSVSFFADLPSGFSLTAASGGEKIKLYPSASNIIVPLSALKVPYSQLEFTENGDAVAAALVYANDRELLPEDSEVSSNPVVPVPCDPGLIIKWPQKNWRARDYELFVWDRFPHILIMDTSSYAFQDKMFKRLAFFVEKEGYRGKLWEDSVIADKHGYNAHDYKADDLARFYETARKTGFAINQEEYLLKKILIRNGVLTDEGEESVSAGKGAILSISQSTKTEIRAQLIAHEAWHGVFFEDEEFRNTVASIYYTVDQNELEMMKAYFTLAPGLGYDLNNDFLMHTEFASYLLQFDLKKVQAKWLFYANRYYCREKAAALSDYINSTGAAGLYSADAMLDEYVNSRWSLNAGRVWSVTTLTDAEL